MRPSLLHSFISKMGLINIFIPTWGWSSEIFSSFIFSFIIILTCFKYIMFNPFYSGLSPSFLILLIPYIPCDLNFVYNCISWLSVWVRQTKSLFFWNKPLKKDEHTLLPIARPKPHATAPTSRSPICVLRDFLTLENECQKTYEMERR